MFASGAHAGTGGASTATPTDELTVGALLDLKSGWTTLGRASRVTLRLAVADANARLARRGSGTRVRLKVIDVHGDPQATVRALRRLAAAGVRVVIGPQASAEVRAVRAAAGALGVVLISQGSTAHSLAVRGDNVFRFVPDDLREGEALVALLRRDGVDAIVPVWRNDAGNAGLADSVLKRFRRLGGSVADGVRYGTGVSDFTPTIDRVRTQVGSLRAGGASRVAVYLAAFDEVVDLFETATRDAFFGCSRGTEATASRSVRVLSARRRRPPSRRALAIRTRYSASATRPPADRESWWGASRRDSGERPTRSRSPPTTVSRSQSTQAPGRELSVTRHGSGEPSRP